MKTKHVLGAVMAVALLVTTNAQAAKQTEKTKVVNVSAKSEEYVNDIRQKLVNCQSTHTNEVSMMRVDIDKKVLQARERSEYADLSFERLKAQKEVVDAKRAAGFDFRKCMDDAKNDVNNSVKSYVSLFKNDAQKSLAKQVASQWFVTIDAVGEKHFGMELSKFDKAASDMKIELAMD